MASLVYVTQKANRDPISVASASWAHTCGCRWPGGLISALTKASCRGSLMRRKSSMLGCIVMTKYSCIFVRLPLYLRPCKSCSRVLSPIVKLRSPAPAWGFFRAARVLMASVKVLIFQKFPSLPLREDKLPQYYLPILPLWIRYLELNHH